MAAPTPSQVRRRWPWSGDPPPATLMVAAPAGGPVISIPAVVVIITTVGSAISSAGAGIAKVVPGCVAVAVALTKDAPFQASAEVVPEAVAVFRGGRVGPHHFDQAAESQSGQQWWLGDG